MRQWKTVRGGSSSEFMASASQYIAGVRSCLPSRYDVLRIVRRLVPLASAATGGMVSTWRRPARPGARVACLGRGWHASSSGFLEALLRSQSRLQCAELFVKRCSHRWSIHRVEHWNGRALGKLQHEKSFDVVNTVRCLAVKSTLLGTRHPRREKEAALQSIIGKPACLFGEITMYHTTGAGTKN